MNIDFVKVPFSNNPSMSRYEGQIFNKNPSKIYLLEKQKQLSKFGDSIYGQTKVSIDNELLLKTLKFLNFNNLTTIKELTLMLEEDFAVMYEGKMELGSICFPSGWEFKEKLGKDFT